MILKGDSAALNNHRVTLASLYVVLHTVSRGISADEERHNELNHAREQALSHVMYLLQMDDSLDNLKPQKIKGLSESFRNTLTQWFGRYQTKEMTQEAAIQAAYMPLRARRRNMPVEEVIGKVEIVTSHYIEKIEMPLKEDEVRDQFGRPKIIVVVYEHCPPGKIWTAFVGERRYVYVGHNGQWLLKDIFVERHMFGGAGSDRFSVLKNLK